MRARTVAAGALAVLVLATGCGASGGSGGSSASTPAGNGVASKSAQEILAAATTAAKAQSSVHIAGVDTTGTDKTELDLSLAKGVGATGTITMGGNKIQLITTTDSVYMKADKAF